MTRAEAIETFHKASHAFSALEAMARTEHALIAAYYTANDLYFPKEE